jgi:hypothetical protein
MLRLQTDDGSYPTFEKLDHLGCQLARFANPSLRRRVPSLPVHPHRRLRQHPDHRLQKLLQLAQQPHPIPPKPRVQILCSLMRWCGRREECGLQRRRGSEDAREEEGREVVLSCSKSDSVNTRPRREGRWDFMEHGSCFVRGGARLEEEDARLCLNVLKRASDGHGQAGDHLGGGGGSYTRQQQSASLPSSRARPSLTHCGCRSLPPLSRVLPSTRRAPP